ncbi:Uncharacterised protein [Klebsiella pneumoniae]|nr:Uncharacterised protein [Klebsiella pneumoniae]
MQHVIGTYQDEWRTAIEDPEAFWGICKGNV